MADLKNATFARLNGLAIMLVIYGTEVSTVRYVGAEGMQIRKDQFQVETKKLSEF